MFGYPIEMFVSGNTVHALLRDSLYLNQVGDQFQYERHNVSQLVTIDISDVNQPRVVGTLDITGQLREGVSRKIDSTIYVVSYFPQSYYWGWQPDADPKEQAWVYSFNVSDPAHPVEKDRHKIFEGGGINEYDPDRGTSVNRSFSGVTISATSNALMVVENWYLSWSITGGSPGSRPGCGGQSYYSGQEAVVSLIDISDPQGNIAEHARFRTAGQLNDQFKMTYVHDAAANTGTFYGIFNRQVFSSSDCNWQGQTQNTLESWDVTQRGKPHRLDTLDFGKPNETVRGSAFDVERKVAYAITAERIDPMYALGFADRADLKKLSEIDGLSGDMSVFRLVGNRQFLLAVGQDNSETCQGLQVGGRTATRMAVSVIDVRDLAAIRLVQRKCVAIEGAEWVGSGVNNNLDQAHKMLGMHADGDLNVLSVPVYYSKRLDGSGNQWWWYRQETAVGLLTWDLRKYDPARPAAEQQVIESFGSFVHPHGEVRRSILFRHQGAGASAARRMMINLSDTHASVVDLEDLRSPQLQSTIELAPYYNQVYRFGDHLVEQVQSRPGQTWWTPTFELAEFRVRKAGGDLESTPVLAKFEAAQVQRVFKHGENLVVFRQREGTGLTGQTGTIDVQVFDLRDPTHPRQAGRVEFPSHAFNHYYPYWCGMGAYWGGYWFGQQSTFALTDQGIAFYLNEWDHVAQQPRHALAFLDLRDPDAPKVSRQNLDNGESWGAYGMVADPVEPRGFYVSHRKQVGTVVREGYSYDQFRYYAQRWEPMGDRWSSTREINIPGHLVRTWKAADGTRMFLSQDQRYRWVAAPPPNQGTDLKVDFRLSLMRQIALAGSGDVAAEFLDGRVMDDLHLSALMLAGDNQDKLVVGAQPQISWYSYSDPKTRTLTWEQRSDRLLVFDLSASKLDLVHDRPTRMYGLSLMGTHKGKLFLNVSAASGFNNGGWSWVSGTGDGILVVDLRRRPAPRRRGSCAPWATPPTSSSPGSSRAGGHSHRVTVRVRDVMRP